MVLFVVPAVAWTSAMLPSARVGRVMGRRPAVTAEPPVTDGSAATVGDWDNDAFMRGYQNPAEMPAFEVSCSNLPKDLQGTYFRNGYARFVKYDGKKVRHPFDADGMVTAVTIDGSKGTAVVRQRYVATDGARQERKEGRSIFPGQFGGALPFWEGGANFKNLANTGVLNHGGRLLALWEGSRPTELDPLSLATKGEWTINGNIGTGPTDGFSAHPRPSDKALANFAYFGSPVSGKTSIKFWDFESDSFDLRSPIQEHEVPGFGLFHDFLTTENWFIVLAAPATWGPGGWESLKQTWDWVCGKRPVTSMIEFNPSEPTVAYFFPRPGSPKAQEGVKSVALDTFFSFHHANAFEDVETGFIVFDTVRADELKVDDSSLGGGVEAGQATNRFILEDLDYSEDVPRVTLMRYSVDLASGTWSSKQLSPRHVEFPSVAPSKREQAHRYIYSSPGPKVDEVSPQNGVLKTDTLDPSRSQIWLPPAHKFCGEVLFTAKAGSQEEDDGYLMTLCFDGDSRTSELLVFDAKDVTAGPISHVPLASPAGVSGEDGAAMLGPGHGLHGTFVPGMVPTLDEIQTAEKERGQVGAFFLSD